MNNVRVAIGEVFASPMHNLSFVTYFSTLGVNGKITERSLLELITVLFTYVEEIEKKNEQYEANFKEIEAILSKLVYEKVETKQKGFTKEELDTIEDDGLDIPNVGNFLCDSCGKVAKSQLGLLSHKRTHTTK